MNNRLASFVANYIFYGGLATYFYTGYTYQGPYAGAHLIASALCVIVGVLNVTLSES